MHLAGAFQYSTYIEIAVIELEKSGVAKENIVVIPFEPREPNVPNVTLAHMGDPTGANMIFIVGAILMLLGSIYGFVIPLGPVLCAIIGLVVGGLIGYGIDQVIIKRNKRIASGLTEVVLIVKCQVGNVDHIEKLLWEHQAFAVTKIPS